MQFAYPLPWWGWALVFAGIALGAYGAYTRTAVTLVPARRYALAGLRALTLLLLVVFLLRPMQLVPSTTLHRPPVAVLVDVSRSMSLADAGGKRRIEAAADLLTRQLLPAVASQFQADVLTFGESLAPGSPPRFAATARRSDVSEALQAVRERYRGRPLAGIILLSDGGDTNWQDAASAVGSRSAPIFPIGIGDPRPHRDREVLAVTAGDANVEHALVDLSVSAVSHGYGATPMQLRILANGKPIDTREVTPPADGSPIQETFLAAPDRTSPTLFTVEIPEDSGEAVTENNRRSVLVSPPGRPRRLLFVEGAPGFEHSFIKRAWAKDSSIDFDAVVRKGQNEQAQETFYLQAPPARGMALLSGFPKDRRALYAYDALILGNMEGDFLSRDQLTLASDFVAERGGGLLVFGALSFVRGGFMGTALEETLPLELSDRRGGLTRTSARQGDAGSGAYTLMLTRDGELHPMMRLGLDREETVQRWLAVPPLAAIAMLGEPRPGAQVLAVTRTPDGGAYPLVAVQRYGRGRSMIFAGEATWRWRMSMPSADRTHEVFWRQVARWLSTGAPDPVSINDVEGAVPGDTLTLETVVRDADFTPIRDATVTMQVTLPGGQSRELSASLADAAAGLYRARLHADQGGVYRVAAEARRGNTVLGTSTRWVLVGGADLEMADPRLNEDLLMRLASASGGRYVAPRDISTLPDLLTAAQPEALPPDRRDLWNNFLTFALIVGLLSGEWVLRRRWGMR